jgi:hypothetical protein
MLVSCSFLARFLLVSYSFLPDKKLAVVETLTLQQKELVPICT